MQLIYSNNKFTTYLYAGLNFKLKKTELKNTVSVSINIENKINFNLANGQYLAIVHLIQQNFPEFQHNVPEKFAAPNPKFVHLQVSTDFVE